MLTYFGIRALIEDIQMHDWDIAGPQLILTMMYLILDLLTLPLQILVLVILGIVYLIKKIKERCI